MRLGHELMRLLLPVFDRVAAGMTVDEPWERVETTVAATDFGPGSRHPFAWYFEGVSTVSVSSVEEVAGFLFECQYAKDAELFHEADFWQHPLTFEKLRAGDCEDHALWGWRKLAELGIDAALVVGTVRRESYAEGGHAWVVFEDAGQRFLLEGTAAERPDVVRPFDEARVGYVPHAAVNARFETWGYAGALLTAKLRHQGRQRRDT